MKNAILLLSGLCFFAGMFWSSGKAETSSSITYDGYKNDYVQIWFEAYPRADGTFKISLSSPNEGWREVARNNNFAGYSVRMEPNGYRSVVFLRSLNFPNFEEIRIAQAEPGYAQIEQGTFGMVGLPPVIAHVGDTVTLGKESITVRRLSSDSATIYLENEGQEMALPLSSVGSLRAQFVEVERRMGRRNRDLAMLSGQIDIRTLFLFIFLGDILVYGFILVGMLTLPRFIAGQSRRRRVRHD